MRRQDKLWLGLLLSVFLFVGSQAFADSNNPVRITGAQTPGDCVQISSTNVLTDSGGTCGGGGGGSLAITSTAGNTDYFALFATNTGSSVATVFIDKVTPLKYHASTGLFSMLGITTTSFTDNGAAALNGTTTFGGAGSVLYAGSSSGSTQLKAAAAASGVLTLPAATDTLMGKATTDILTNKTFNTSGTGNSFSIAGTAITSIQGNQAKVQTAIGATTSGDCIMFDANGNTIDSGGACGGGAGSLTVTATADATSRFILFATSTGTTSTVFVDTAGPLNYVASTGAIGLHGPETITSASASALSVGSSGATNPTLKVDNSTASQVGGVSISGGATGGTTTIAATDSGSNQALTVQSKGTGTLSLTSPNGALNLTASGAPSTWTNNGSGITLNGTSLTLQQAATPRVSLGSNGQVSITSLGTGAQNLLTLSAAGRNGITASTEVNAINTNTVTFQHNTGALTMSRDYLFSGNNYSFVGASTATDIASVGFTLPGCGTNATCTNVSGLYHASLALVTTGAITNSYAVNVAADTGATNNFAARFDGLVTLPSITTDATHTDSSLCQDTTTHNIYFGSGTLGICLGTSSARYKNHIVTMSAGLEQLMKLRPVNFNFKDSRYGNTAKLQYGFIAEEAADVLPDLVDKDSEGRYNTFDYLGLVPVLVHAVQEQQIELDTLHGAFPFHKCFFNLLVCPN